MSTTYDVAIIGGGPGGLAAALALGRARKRVLLCDGGPRRNAAAVHIHNFVTRDGTPPDEFRRIGRAQLATYPNVEIRDTRVEAITGERGAFQLGGASARRIVLATGMIDEMLPIAGFRELWGHAIFQCPYCHGWEVRERRWAFLARDPHHLLPFAFQLRAWTRDIVVLTNGALEVPDDTRAKFRAAGIGVETAPIEKLVGREQHLEGVQLASGDTVPCEVLYAHPPQKHVEIVQALGLELDEAGFVRVDPMTRETSIPGIYAAGDLTTRMQGAMFAAAAAVQTVAALNVELTMELATTGAV